MSDVVIAGIGYTEVGEHWEIGLRELAVQAIHTAINDCGNLQT
jgi:acetyl-CoA acetyltransferase